MLNSFKYVITLVYDAHTEIFRGNVLRNASYTEMYPRVD